MFGLLERVFRVGISDDELISLAPEVGVVLFEVVSQNFACLSLEYIAFQACLFDYSAQSHRVEERSCAHIDTEVRSAPQYPPDAVPFEVELVQLHRLSKDGELATIHIWVGLKIWTQEAKDFNGSYHGRRVEGGGGG
ncbi:hypothetical protein MSAN_01893100 [Mycena sanguinolenta]|uniref:Uncharacterized protein n=1 Tax=Mycena sanguinolenta TaxID=230812 RepID=A0A8H6XNS6_9AGAR|nr:hypothetical protein MSAN_01893100 [Mycena sanguinolenta]